MKLAIKADSWQQAINQLKECGFHTFSSMKKVSGEYIFKGLDDSHSFLQIERFNFTGVNPDIVNGIKDGENK